jgi:hypothetical protein
MRSLTGSNRVWGGCMLITVGDFRQVRTRDASSRALTQRLNVC